MKKAVMVVGLSLVPMMAAAESRTAIEVLAGSATHQISYASFSHKLGSDTSMGLRLAFHANDRFAVELGYTDYGKVTDTYYDAGDRIDESAEATSINLGVKGVYPMSEQFGLVGRIGFAMWDFKYLEEDEYFGNSSFSKSGTDLYLGFGFEYRVTRDFHLGLDYNYVSMDLGSSVSYDVGSFALYAGMSF
ncbi:porin family protein [Marinospirillum alkaliphilum]|uniref:Outer membrane protein beta-barrel domain-containing protein n=1 Tax=Marinospirillum alkaliphilum DSM 21637 TaxID=1122209 RepID=A0A1K1V7C1_9GAMM|nr:porin family protein [Marinospirillum alkaliphilum]SFX20643.1 Outer membrane protein beta-barrel domain-containing protein [Marinospirillum alkaliphilum DSM 21637]